jgi:hypothetical protein
MFPFFDLIELFVPCSEQEYRQAKIQSNTGSVIEVGFIMCSFESQNK